MLEAAVLVVLQQRPTHGYGLLRPVQDLGLGVCDISRIYRALRHLEAEGIIASRWDTPPRGGGPARKIYSITGFGHRDLHQRMTSLRAMTQVMHGIEARFANPAAVTVSTG